MKKILVTKVYHNISFLLCSFILWSCTPEFKRTEVDLLSSRWSFSTTNSANSKLSKSAPVNDLIPSADSTFTIKFTVDIPQIKEELNILEIPEILKVTLRQHNPKDRRIQNYPGWKMQDGSVPVLEASLSLQLPVENNAIRNMVIGIPLAMLEKPTGKHDVILNFSGSYWTMYVDGKLLDNDFPLGYPVWKETTTWNINENYISEAEIFFPAIKPEREAKNASEVNPEIQYWTPQGHNSWVGDVANFYHEGRYHVFYLFDRRTHSSKFGRGGHYFEHLSTTDFKTWTEHEAATPIEEQWETFGTGTPFLFDGKLCISYGLHTTRIYPAEMTTLPTQWDFYNKNGYTGTFYNNNTPGFPAGSTYSISQDGISNFRKTNLMYHPCENPSVYTDPEGNLKMLANYGARGTWASESIDGGWRSVNPDFPPGGDCTFFFRWNNFDYIIGGFTGLWSKPVDKPENEYQSMVKKGLDFYNGMSVPAITEISDDRFLMAGWLTMHGWGGALVIHEMIQFPDGQIGTKWMNEIMPETPSSTSLANSITDTMNFPTDNNSFLLTFDVHPGNNLENKASVLFQSENGEENSCEIQFSPNDKFAQYNNGKINGFSDKEKTLREGGSPQAARNYAIENIPGMDKPFTVRIIVKRTDKFGGSLIDTEIAGTRTMISYRPDLEVKNILFRTENTEIKNIKISKLKDIQ